MGVRRDDLEILKMSLWKILNASQVVLCGARRDSSGFLETQVAKDLRSIPGSSSNKLWSNTMRLNTVEMQDIINQELPWETFSIEHLVTIISILFGIYIDNLYLH